MSKKTISPKDGSPDIIVEDDGLTEDLLSSDVTTRVEAVVCSARDWLPKVSNELKAQTLSDKVKKWAAKYFKTDANNGPDDGELAAIKAVLANTSNGIGQKFTINVHVDAADDAYGYVTHYVSSNGHGHLRDSDDDLIASKGPIHVQHTLFSPTRNLHLAVITFIHEATHRYANTFDFDDKGYIDNDGDKFWSAGITKNDALLNADSHAWFIYKVISGE